MELKHNTDGKLLLKKWWKSNAEANFTAIEKDFNSHTTSSTLDHPDKSVTTAKIADKAVTNAKLADTSVTAEKLGASAVETAKIKDANVTTTKIADANVTTAKLADKSVAATKIADEAVTTAKIVNAAVTSDKLAGAVVTTAKIKDANVTTAKIADSAVTTAKIADANVTENKIASGAVTAAKLGADVTQDIQAIKDAAKNEAAARLTADTELKAAIESQPIADAADLLNYSMKCDTKNLSSFADDNGYFDFSAAKAHIVYVDADYSKTDTYLIAADDYGYELTSPIVTGSLYLFIVESNPKSGAEPENGKIKVGDLGGISLKETLEDLEESAVKQATQAIENSQLQTVDSELSTTSENAVQNKVVTGALNDKVNTAEVAQNNDLISGFNMGSKGWYRIAEFTAADEIYAKGMSANSCEIILRRKYETYANEYHHLQLSCVFKGSTFSTIASKTWSGCFGMTNIRHVYNSTDKKAYIDVYHYFTKTNNVQITINNGCAGGGYWKPLSPTTTTAETAADEEIMSSYVIPENAANITSADVDSALSTTSANPVQNKAVAAALNDKVSAAELDLLKAYSATPQKIGTWLDGTPIWRMAFNKDLTDSDKSDGTFILDLSTIVKISDEVFVVDSLAMARCGNSPCVIDDYHCEPDDPGVAWKIPVIKNLDFEGYYGWIEFVTAESNIK
jgi:hypothetical protein